MRRGGLVFVALVIAAGIFRLGGPTGLGTTQGGVPSNPSEHSERTKKSQPLQEKLLQNAEYDQRLKSTIQSFFGTDCKEKDCKDFEKYWNVPPNMRGNVRFLIAIFPDPKHTRLGLFLDRGIEAVQRAAQTEDFDFDRAILPWNARELPESKDLFSLLLQAEMEADSEKYPGLLIFREGWGRAGKQDEEKEKEKEKQWKDEKCDKPPLKGNRPLFVFVVGEKPTGGIDKEQFGRALDIIGEIRGSGQKKMNEPLFILGPTSSGSFYSLKEAFDINSKRLPAEVFLYSGIARAAAAREWFMRNKPENVRYQSFLEDDNDLLLRFDDFAEESLKIDKKEIAVLSEDETSYGRWREDKEKDPRSSWFSLQFPRGISQFRSAYQKEFGSPSQVPEVVVPGRPVLRLDLEPHGEDDSVPTFARGQMPLSQEAVMIQIVSALRQAATRPKLVILRATDPLDGLFLARYLRTHYPEGRIVVVEPDLLMARDQDGLLAGTTAISNYPLVLREEVILYQLYRDPAIPRPNTERIFASLSSAGTFNATIALLGELDKCECATASAFELNAANIPRGHYFGYGTPSFATYRKNRKTLLKPGLWVSVLGRDGFWAVQAYEPDIEAKNTVPENGRKSTLAQMEGNSVYPNVGLPPSRPLRATYGILLALSIAHTALLVWGSILSPFEPRAMYAVIEGSASFGSGDGFSDRKRRATILTLGTLFLCAGLLLLACVWNGTRQACDLRSDWTRFAWPMFCPILLGGFSFVVIWKRHQEKGIATIGSVTLLALFVCALFPRTWFPATESLLVTRRVLALTSGVSPVLPVLFLLLMGVCAFWFELRGMALVDVRQPELPRKAGLEELDHMDEEQAKKILSAMRPLALNWWVVIPSVVMVLALWAVLSMDFGRPMQSLEGSKFDRVYGGAFWVAILVLAGCIFKLASTWMACRVLLAALDRKPLRDAFKRLKEFSWGPLWSMSGAALRESYRFLSRQLECLGRVKAGLENQYGMSEEASREIGDQVKRIEDVLRTVWTYYEEAKLNGAHEPEMMGAIAVLQREMAWMTTLLYKNVLRPMWSQDEFPATSAYPEALGPDRSEFELTCEEYVSLTYANFLVTVLLRMRTMVVCAIGMYVFLLLSLSSYPFSPSSSIFTLAVILILMLVGVIGIVYAQMHRDNILSRLTDTTEGELGVDFWLQFGSAGAIAVLTFLSSQFPDISRIVSSFLQPFLQAVK